MNKPQPILPLPQAGGGQGVGARFKLGRPTAIARAARKAPTDAEATLWRRLQRSQLGGLKFSRQMPIGGFRPDFVCRSHKLIVELDGSQHANATPYDEARTKHLEALGYRVLRFWNNQVMQELEGVIGEIERVLANTPSPSPSRWREGDGGTRSGEPLRQ